MKVGDLVKFNEKWRDTLRYEEARLRRWHQLTPADQKRYSRIDKLALVTQTWETHSNFAVIFLGETVEVDFNDEIIFSDEIMEKV